MTEKITVNGVKYDTLQIMCPNCQHVIKLSIDEPIEDWCPLHKVGIDPCMSCDCLQTSGKCALRELKELKDEKEACQKISTIKIDPADIDFDSILGGKRE